MTPPIPCCWVVFEEPPTDPLNLRARPYVQVLDVRRPARAATFSGWAGCGSLWPDGWVIARNPSCGGLCRSYWPAVRTDGGTCGAVSRPALLILRGGMAQCAVRRGRGAAAFFTSRSYYKCVKLLRNHQSNSKFDLSILSPRAQANGERDRDRRLGRARGRGAVARHIYIGTRFMGHARESGIILIISHLIRMVHSSL